MAQPAPNHPGSGLDAGTRRDFKERTLSCWGWASDEGERHVLEITYRPIGCARQAPERGGRGLVPPRLVLERFPEMRRLTRSLIN